MKKILILLTAILLISGCSKGVVKEEDSKEKATEEKKEDVYVKQIIVDESYEKTNTEVLYNEDGSIAYTKFINLKKQEDNGKEHLLEEYYKIVDDKIVVELYFNSELDNTKTFDLDGNYLNTISASVHYNNYIDRFYNEDNQVSKIIHTIDSEFDGTVFPPKTVYDFFYKDKKLIKYTSNDGNRYEEFTYNDDGKLLSSSAKSDNYDNHTTYEYDEKGRIILEDYEQFQFVVEYSKQKITTYNVREGKVIGEIIKLFDKNDRKISEEHLALTVNNTTIVTANIDFLYDSKGNKIKETLSNYDENGKVIKFRETNYEYDSLNRLIKETVLEDDEESIIEYSYLSENLNYIVEKPLLISNSYFLAPIINRDFKIETFYDGNSYIKKVVNGKVTYEIIFAPLEEVLYKNK